MPKVSVLMTVRNSEKYIKEALGSVLTQSYRDFEFVIIDDASTDNTVSIVKEYAKKDKRIRLAVNEKKVGRPEGLNQGVKLCRGKYIAIIDSDDVWCDQDKLKKQVGFLNKHQGYGIVGTNVIRIDERGREIDRLKYRSTDQAIRNILLSSNQFAHSSVLISKEVFDRAGLYSEQKKHWHVEDYEFFLRAGRQFKVANLPEFCLKYRIHSSSLAVKNELNLKREGVGLILEYGPYYPGKSRAVLLKMTSLLFPRNFTDYLFRKNKLFRWLYQRGAGVEKQF